MADDLSLLLRIRGDAAGAKAAVAESRAAVASLRSSFSSELNQMQAVSKTALGGIADNLNVFVGQRIPLVGGAFVRVTENIKGLSSESKKVDQDIAKFTQTVGNLATNTGKTSGEISKFLTSFVQLETQAQRDAAAIEKFGAAAAQTLIPQLEKAGAELATVATSTEAAAAGAGGLVAALGPIGIAAIGIAVELAAVAIGFGLVVKAAESLGGALFDLGKTAADFRGKLVDLSQQTGISVETLSALEVVAKTTGSEIGSITASLGIFQRKLEEAQDPTTKIAGLFRDLGVDAETTEGALRQTLAAIAAMPEGFAQTAKALELFGRGGKAFLAIAKEANGDIDATIKKLRELGLIVSTEDAVAADKFNDQLALLQFQFRALLGNDVIPAATKALEDISKVLKDNREAVNAVGKALGLLADGIGNIVKGALRNLQIGIDILNAKWQEASIAVELLKPKLNEIKAIYQAIATAVAFISGHPLPKAPVPEIGADTAAPGFLLGETAKQIQSRIQALKELTGFQSAAAEDAKRIGQLAIDEADRQFKHGQINREQQLKQTLFGLQQQRDAEVNGIDQIRKLKLEEFKLAREEGSDATSLINELAVLDGKRRGLQDKFIADSKDAQSKADADNRDAAEKHQQATLNIFLEGAKNRINAIQDELATGQEARESAALKIDAIETEQLRRRQENLQKQLELPQIELDVRKKINEELATVSKNLADVERGQIESLLHAATKAALEAEKQISALRDVDFKKRETAITSQKEQTTDPNEIQKINDKLKALAAERTEWERQQSVKRTEYARIEADLRTAIFFGSADDVKRIGAASDAARIADLKILAAALIGSEEETSDAISQIHRNAEARDAAIAKAEKLRRRQEELKQTLESAGLELGARQKVNAELDTIAKSLVAGEQQQLEGIKAAVAVVLNAETQVQALQEAGFRRREAALTREKEQTTDPAELERINVRIKALDIERTDSAKELSAIRTQVAQSESAVQVAIASGNAADIIKASAASDVVLIASLKTLAAAQISAEDETANAISQIRRKAEERDAAATKADQLRRQRDQLTQTLQGANLELEARKKIKTELDAISTSLTTGGQRQIEDLQATVKSALDAEKQIQTLQEANFLKRATAISAEKERTTDPADVKRLNDRLKSLEIERTSDVQEQATRRGNIVRTEVAAEAAVTMGGAAEIKQTGDAFNAAAIASLKVLSTERIKVEKATAQGISEIHRDGAARDAAATKAAKLRQRQEELRNQIEGSQLELGARQKLNAELEKLSTERATRERSQIDALLKTATDAALEAEARIKVFQATDITKRKEDLTVEKSHTTDPAEIKRINDQIAGLDTKRTANEKQQSDFRTQNAQTEADLRALILTGSFTSIQEIAAATDKIRITSQQALEAAGVQSAEETAKNISEIKREAERRDADLSKTDRLRRREEEIKQILQGANLEVEARKRVVAELAQISKDLATVEKRTVEDLINARTAAALKAEKEIKKIEDDAFDGREKKLRARLNDPIDVVAKQAIIDQLKALDQERKESDRQSELTITQIHKDAAQTRIDILVANAANILELGDSADAQRIASIKAFVNLRLKTEEQAEKEILAIKLAAVDREVAALKIQQTKVGAIADPNAQAKARNDLINQLKVLADQRTALEAQGDRDVEEGRQKDLANEQRYSDQLVAIRQRTVDAQRETQQLAVNLLVLKGAPQAQVIAAQLKLELANLKTRHDAIQKSIDDDKKAVNDRIALLTNLTERLQEFGQQESDVYKQAVIELAKANEKKKVLNAEEEAERARHNTAIGTVTAGADQSFTQINPFEEIGKQIAGVTGLGKEAAAAIGETLSGAFSTLANAVGQAVQSFVLFGKVEGGLKKFAATLIAQIASMAAVQAVYQLAQGLAWLALNFFFPNPAYARAAATAFTSAAIFGSIAGVAAVAGRAIAGSSFADAGGGGTSSTGNTAGRAPTTQDRPQVINAGRNEVSVVLVLRHDPGGAFQGEVVKSVIQDAQGNGAILKLIDERAGG